MCWASLSGQVLVLQWIGTSGHFALGNSNTLATVDVAGAYIVRFYLIVLWYIAHELH